MYNNRYYSVNMTGYEDVVVRNITRYYNVATTGNEACVVRKLAL